MIPFVQKYACVIVLVLMSAFGACLVADEWNDMRHAWQDLQIEATAEIEAEDFEWDEFEGDNGAGKIATINPMASFFSLLYLEGQGKGNSPFISDKQRLGLVRRYAPRKALVCNNYVLK